MLAVQYASFDPSSVLEIAERPQPHAGPGVVRIRVLATSINPIDRLLRSGALEQPSADLPGEQAGRLSVATDMG